MRVYFVRHGESALSEMRHQFPDTPLSANGYVQAEALSGRFIHLPIDIILSSTYTRALETAQIIKRIQLRDVQLIKSELLVERKMPTVFWGKETNDADIEAIHMQLREHFYEPNWHYADEENFTNLLFRAKRAFELIESQKKAHIVVVTHGYFLLVLLYYMLFGMKVDPLVFRSFREHVANSYTGLTVCDYIHDTWKLVTWNDLSHTSK